MAPTIPPTNLQAETTGRHHEAWARIFSRMQSPIPERGLGNDKKLADGITDRIRAYGGHLKSTLKPR